MPAKSKAQQKFMGMVHAAQKGEKPASKEVAKVAKTIPKKSAKDYAETKHKGLPEKKKSKIKETLEKINQLQTMISEAKKKMKGKDPCWDSHEMVGTKKKGGKEVPNCVPKKVSETQLNEDHFKVGDTVTCTKSGMTGKVVKLDKPETGKYYHVKREDGKTVKYAPSELKKSTKVKEGIYTADMGEPPQDIDGGSAPPMKKSVAASKKSVDPAPASKQPVAAKKATTTPSKQPVAAKVKESKKEDDLPFDGPYKDADDNKDKYGNVIKTKNMAKHLAKKGRAEVEEKSKKKKETVSEGWGADSQRRAVDDDNRMWAKVMSKYAGDERMTAALEKVKRTGMKADGAELQAMKVLGATTDELQAFRQKQIADQQRGSGLEEGWTHDTLASKLFETSEDHHDHEASMAKAQLMRIAEQSIELFKMIKEGDNLEGWVASKITKANDYINAVHQNLSYDDAKDQMQTVSGDDDYIAELRKNLEQQIKS
jgi:hypothetical protein